MAKPVLFVNILLVALLGLYICSIHLTGVEAQGQCGGRKQLECSQGECCVLNSRKLNSFGTCTKGQDGDKCNDKCPCSGGLSCIKGVCKA